MASMNHNLGLTMFSAALLVMGVAAPAAYADNPAPPQPGTVCNMTADSPAANTGAQTFAADGVLKCVAGPQVGIWERIDGIERPVHTWFTYGSEATLTGEDVIAGEYWVGSPVRVDGHCTVEQLDADGGAPVTRTNSSPGMYFDFPIIENVATMKMTGYCNWVMMRGLGEPPPRA
jgi:hypothetical protein